MEENDEVKLISNDPVMLSARKYGGSGGSPSWLLYPEISSWWWLSVFFVLSRRKNGVLWWGLYE